MPEFLASQPSRLGIFVTNLASGQPLARLPLYAEVAVPRVVPAVAPEPRLQEAIRRALQDIDAEVTGAMRQQVEKAMQQALGETLDAISRSALKTEFQKSSELLHAALKAALKAARRDRFSDIDPASLKGLFNDALREIAPGMGLGVVQEAAGSGIIWADPLGMLTTDHMGYASFDLKRLRPEASRMLVSSIEARRKDPSAVPEVAIWVYPYGKRGASTR